MTPREPEQVLAVFPRRRNGRTAEVRVSLGSVPDAGPLLQVRRWILLPSNEWRPTMEGVAIKPAELRELEGAIGKARTLLNASERAS